MNSSRKVLVLTSSLVSLAISGTAFACPGSYATAACDTGGADICMMANTTFDCDLARNGDSTTSTLTAVYGYSGSYDYSVWGTDAAGNDFCCEVTDSTLERVSVMGSAHADTIAFNYGAYNLENHGAVSRVTGWAAGAGGNDVISGSNSTGSYLDSLHGDEDSDTIYGYEGKDEITGDAGNDTIYGGNGGDILHGNDGDDTVYGEAGDDAITGDAGADKIVGGDGADFLNGNLGNDGISGSGGGDVVMGNEGQDHICGDNGTDDLCGGADDDQLWGGGGTDEADGGLGTDKCSAEANMACESTLTGKPSNCP